MSKEEQEQWTPPPGARPDPDRPRARYVLAKFVQVGDQIMVVHRAPMPARSRHKRVKSVTEFERGRTVTAIEKGDRITFTFEPVHGAASVLPDVDPERRFVATKLAPRKPNP